MEDFLTRPKAIRFEEIDNSRTYLILDSQKVDIHAYFAPSFKKLVLETAKIRKTQVQRMDGNNKYEERIWAFLIGQLVKNAGVDQNPVSIGDILNGIYSVIAKARTLVSGCLIILEWGISQS